MLLILCPHCGERNESEFQHGGPARALRPENADALDDTQWVDYLTVPNNPIGPLDEKWWHVRGCGSWFLLRRDTLTHQFLDRSDDGT